MTRILDILMEYVGRIYKVINHTSSNLDSDIDIEQLADTACFSRFLFTGYSLPLQEKPRIIS